MNTKSILMAIFAIAFITGCSSTTKPIPEAKLQYNEIKVSRESSFMGAALGLIITANGKVIHDDLESGETVVAIVLNDGVIRLETEVEDLSFKIAKGQRLVCNTKADS